MTPPTVGGRPMATDHEKEIAAMKIASLFRHNLNRKLRLSRKTLIQRLQLEVKLRRLMKFLTLSCGLTLFLCMSLVAAGNGKILLNLTNSYTYLLHLYDVEEMHTIDDITDFFKTLSTDARNVQPSSSVYFEEHVMQKVLPGMHSYNEETQIEVAGIMAQPSFVNFSFTAWVQKDMDGAGYIIRKPLDPKLKKESSTCWGWKYGSELGFDYGAHDFASKGWNQGKLYEKIRVNKTATGWKSKPGKKHFHTLTVSGPYITFYEDGKKIEKIPLPRPITDCSGTVMAAGKKGMTVGEVIFYPWALQETEIGEIYQEGHTLASIATGKIAYGVDLTSIDEVKTQMRTGFGKIEYKVQAAKEEVSMKLVVTQQEIERFTKGDDDAPKIGKPLFEGKCKNITCNMIEGVQDTFVIDSYIGHGYYDMLPPDIMNGQQPGSLMEVHDKDIYAYDTSSFPSSLGKSFSMTFWINWVAYSGSYIAAKYRTTADSNFAPCWMIGWNQGKGYLEFLSNKGIVKFYIPNWTDRYMKKVRQMRHIAFVVDGKKKEGRLYVDGILADSRSLKKPKYYFQDKPLKDFDYENDWFDQIDCPTTAQTWIQFNGRKPGMYGMKDSQMQQWRLYPGTALTIDEVQTIQHKAKDPKTKAYLEECKQKVHDNTKWRDANGRGCIWYAVQNREVSSSVCRGYAVRKNCPVACQSESPCYGSKPSPPNVQPDAKVWNRIMAIKPSDRNSKYTLCLSASATSKTKELIDTCKALRKHGELKEATKRIGKSIANLTLCEEVEKAIDPYCYWYDEYKDSSPYSWYIKKGPELWTKKWNGDETQPKSFTMTFWVKLKAWDKNGEAVIHFYAGLFPPEPWLRVKLYQGGGSSNFCPLDTSKYCEDNVIGDLELNLEEWIHVSFWMGPSKKVTGSWEIDLMINNVYNTDYIQTPIGFATSGVFLQAVSVEQELYMSPVEFRVGYPDIGTIEEIFYDNVAVFSPKRGPIKSDYKQAQKVVKYTKKKYSSVGFLAAPPIVLQSKVKRTRDCQNPFGTEVAVEMWGQTKKKRCFEPYECSDDFLTNPMSFLPCTSEEDEEKVFGRTPVKMLGEEVFSEFLMTIAESSLLVRGGKEYSTNAFFDQQTKEAKVVMVMFSQDYGVASLIIIKIEAGSKVKAEVEVKHLQVFGGKDLEAYNAYSFYAFLVTLCFLLDGLWKLVKEPNKKLGAFEVLLALFTGFYLIWSFGFINHLEEEVASIVTDITSVPWTSKTIGVKDKTQSLLDAVERMKYDLGVQDKELTVSFAVTMLAIFSILSATSLHPRMAILVETIARSADDLIHFFLLVMVIFVFFALAGMAQFSAEKEEFKTFSSTMVFLFNVMMGDTSEYFGDENEPRASVYIIFFLVVTFFLCLNFLLAIICDGFARVKEDNEELNCEQDFVSDTKQALTSWILSVRHGWPSFTTIIKEMQEQESKFFADMTTLKAVRPSWGHKSKIAFLRYYGQYDFAAADTVETIPDGGVAEDAERRVAILLNTKPTTYAERLLGQRLDWSARCKIKLSRHAKGKDNPGISNLNSLGQKTSPYITMNEGVEGG